MKKETKHNGIGGKLKKIFCSPVGTAGLFLLAVALLLSSSIGGARAALTYNSSTYASQIQMDDIGVTLEENGSPVAWRNYDKENRDGTWDERTGVLLSGMLAEGEELKVGQVYPEVLTVRNTGTINQYVRVSIYKYWMVKKTASDGTVTYVKGEGDGEKDSQDLDPALIDLHLLCDATGVNNGWLLDKASSTDERTVLYYSGLVYRTPGEEDPEEAGPCVTEPFADTLTIDGEAARRVSQEIRKEGGRTTITTAYQYDGTRFQLEVRVDAVQEHNAPDAILSAWGQKVAVEDGTLRLLDGAQ